MKLVALTSTDLNDNDVESATAVLGVFTSSEKAREAAAKLFTLEISVEDEEWESRYGVYGDDQFLLQLWDHELDVVRPEDFMGNEEE